MAKPRGLSSYLRAGNTGRVLSTLRPVEVPRREKAGSNSSPKRKQNMLSHESFGPSTNKPTDRGRLVSTDVIIERIVHASVLAEG
jgi:hypothetical protein